MKLDLQDRVSIIRLLVAITSIVVIFVMGVMIIEPFIPAILLSLILTLATWPAFIWLEKKLNNRTTLAATVMTLLMGMFFLIPFIFLGATLVDSFRGFATAAIEALRNQADAPPAWSKNIPVAGSYADSFWAEYVQDKQRIPMLLQEHYGDITQRLLAITATIGRGGLDVLLSVIISFFMFRHGVQTANRLKGLIENFGGQKAVHLLAVSKGTLIAVIYGVVGTAVIQGIAAVLSFWLAGIPGAPFLGLLAFILALIPGASTFVWGPAVLWLIMENNMLGTIFIIFVWVGFIIVFVDHMLRPYFISLGSNLPLILILLGIIGGLLAFGFIGLFVGPTLLAVVYNIILEWSQMPRSGKGEVLVIETEPYPAPDNPSAT